MREKKKFILDRLPKRFTEGMFWGNGYMGSLLYVKGNRACFAIDHEELWETRDSGEDMPKGKFSDFIKNPELFFNGTYFQTEPKEVNYYRTRLPGLSFSVSFVEEITGFYGELDYLTATSEVDFTLKGGSRIHSSIYLDSNVNLLKIKMDTEQFDIHVDGWDTTRGNLSILENWRYPKYEKRQEGSITHVLQPYSENGIAVLSTNRQGKDIYITLQASMGLETQQPSAETKCKAQGKAGIAERAEQKIEENTALLLHYPKEEVKFQSKHAASWAEYWNRSDITMPNERLQRAYDAEMYKIYSNEREGGIPVTLMGIWNNDTRMPAWCGDLHNDMNVQACYWPGYKNNHAELGAAYIDYYASIMPRLMERAEKLFGIPDAIHCPVMMAPGGYGAGGEWCFWNCLLGPELFVAADFIWYYEFTIDDKRLAASIYPFLERVLHLYKGIAYEKEDGYLHIPFTNSPEVFKDGPMLIRDDATIVISTLHYILDHMARYAARLGEDNTEFLEFDKKLAPVIIGEKGYPLFPGEDVFESHRHFCQLFPVFPLGTDVHSDCARRSLNAVIDQGYTEYACWSFPYLSIFASRCGRGNMAAMLLELYSMVFCSRNTFCGNGDPNWCGVLRVADTNAGEPSDTFTLEAGFIMAAACSEMFVHRSGKDVYLAYGIPKEWKAASCEQMQIEGRHKISMQLEDYQVKCVRIEAGETELLNFHIADYANFENEGNVALSRKSICVNGENYGESETYALHLEKGNIYNIIIAG